MYLKNEKYWYEFLNNIENENQTEPIETTTFDIASIIKPNVDVNNFTNTSLSKIVNSFNKKNIIELD